MGSSKFYLAVGFIALMAAPLDITADAEASEGNSSNNIPSTTNAKTSSINPTDNKNVSTAKNDNQSSTSQASSKQSTNNSTNTCAKCVSTNTPIFSFLQENVALMGAGLILLCLVISNMVLICCMYRLRRHVSSRAVTRFGDPRDVTEDRYVVTDEQAAELSTIYTMPDKTVRKGNAEEEHKAEGSATKEADPANGDTQSPEQAETLLPEPPADISEPADVAEPADDVTGVLLVV